LEAVSTQWDTFTIKVDSELRKRFRRVCLEKNIDKAVAYDDMMRAFVEKHEPDVDAALASARKKKADEKLQTAKKAFKLPSPSKKKK